MTLNDVYDELVLIVSNVSAQVDVPLESEDFFSEIVSSFSGTREELLKFIDGNIYEWFRYVHHPPNWIQEAEWQFSNGKPMIFVGQIDVSNNQSFFHDEVSFFVFWNPDNNEIKNIIQVA